MHATTNDRAQAVVDKLRAELPAIFLGSKIGELTGHAIDWGTVQNKRSRRVITNESEIFIRSGNRVLVVRDPFLEWWATTLSDARRPPLMPPRRSRRRDRGDEGAQSAVNSVGPATATAAPAVVPARQLPRRQRRNRVDEFGNAVSSG